MPNPMPIALLMDDSCPLVHVYRCHWIDVHHKPPVTEDGRPMPEMNRGSPVRGDAALLA